MSQGVTLTIGSREAARILNRSVPQVTRYVLKGRLKLAGRGYGKSGPLLFDRADVEAFRDLMEREAAERANPPTVCRTCRRPLDEQAAAS